VPSRLGSPAPIQGAHASPTDPSRPHSEQYAAYYADQAVTHGGGPQGGAPQYGQQYGQQYRQQYGEHYGQAAPLPYPQQHGMQGSPSGRPAQGQPYAQQYAPSQYEQEHGGAHAEQTPADAYPAQGLSEQGQPLDTHGATQVDAEGVVDRTRNADGDSGHDVSAQSADRHGSGDDDERPQS